MKLKSTVIPLALLIMVLASAFPVARAETVTKMRFVPVYLVIVPDKLAIEGWTHITIVSKETPQGIKWHWSQVVQFDVIDLTTGEYIGKGFHEFMYNGLPGEDRKEVQNVVSCSPGPELPGISYRLRIVSIMQNGDVKVDVYIEPLGPPDP